MHKLWCDVWYSIPFRLLFIMIPTYMILVVYILEVYGVQQEVYSEYLPILYIIVFAIAVVDNTHPRDREEG